MDLAVEASSARANGLDLPVVVINLAHRADRWQAVSKRMAAIGVSMLIKAPAVDGMRLPEEGIAALLQSPARTLDAPPRSHLTLTRPAIGCFLSHLAIWRWVIAAGLPRVLVLEDDAVPALDARRFRAALDTIPANAGLVLLGRIIMGGLAERPLEAQLARIYYFNGTFAYLITPAACHTLLDRLLPLRSHIDHQVSTVLFQHRHAVQAFYTEPRLFEPDWSLRSDCYVPLADDAAADQELAQIIATRRRTLLDEGRPLLPMLP